MKQNNRIDQIRTIVSRRKRQARALRERSERLNQGSLIETLPKGEMPSMAPECDNGISSLMGGNEFSTY